MAYLTVNEFGFDRVHPLDETETVIGRSRKNPIRLLTEQASRNHCRIIQGTSGEYRVVDNSSSNGTFVNGTRTIEKELKEGDTIGIGQARMVFHQGDPKTPLSPPDSATARIPLQDRNVQLLLHTIVSAASAREPIHFLETVVDNVVEITGAERGILFMKKKAQELNPVVSRNAEGEPLGDLSGISKSIPHHVYDTRKAIFVLDSEDDGNVVESQSVSIYHLRTVMCVPLQVGDKILGVLYVDSHAKTREFSETDLTIFEGVANYLSLMVENMNAAEEARTRAEVQRKSLEQENALLRSALEKRRHLIGNCASMKRVYENIRKVAPTDATVLLHGESGTGKEAIAHVLHDLSPRSNHPLVVIDCAAIPETLLESELFGYRKGAFTDAAGDKPGKFELAQGGTIFLDEIGELSPAMQVKLLRALEQKTITRVGDINSIQIDIRLVAATNRDLEKMVTEGGFRQDLLFRLKVVTLIIPPLRERGEDVQLLAETFLKRANETNGRAVKGLSDEVRKALPLQPWDGNIRELQHRIEQAVILTNHEYLSTEDLHLTGTGKPQAFLETARDAFEKTYLVQALQNNRFNVTHTSKELGISRQHLQNLMKKHDVKKPKDP